MKSIEIKYPKFKFDGYGAIGIIEILINGKVVWKENAAEIKPILPAVSVISLIKTGCYGFNKLVLEKKFNFGMPGALFHYKWYATDPLLKTRMRIDNEKIYMKLMNCTEPGPTCENLGEFVVNKEDYFTEVVEAVKRYCNFMTALDLQSAVKEFHLKELAQENLHFSEEIIKQGIASRMKSVKEEYNKSLPIFGELFDLLNEPPEFKRL